MTFSKSITVWCEECPEWIRVQTKNTKVATKQVRKRGWVSPRYDEHYCPECAEER